MLVVASSASRPLARCATATPATRATASCQARRLPRASEPASHTSPSPNASASHLAAVGAPGGSRPWTRWLRSARLGVRAETMLIAPTTPLKIPRTVGGRSAGIRIRLRLLRASARCRAEPERGGRGGLRDDDPGEDDRAAAPPERAEPVAGEQVAEES